MSRPSDRSHPRYLYVVPDGLVSFEEYEREHHRDLSRMDDRELIFEAHRVQCALACERRTGSERAWLWERLTQVIGERRARVPEAPPDPRGRSK